jgi:high-affinity iron transporter
MLAALTIVFREVFEAGLIIGIILAVTRAVPRRNRWIIAGVFGGVLGACLVAAFAGALSRLFAGMGQELFNAAILGVAVVMLSEGSEVALFLYGVATTDGGSTESFALGGFIGLALGVAVCLLTYQGLLRIPPRPLFKVTTVLISLLAAGMAAQAASFLERANWLTALDSIVWDTGWLLPDHSLLGRTLHTLTGYTDQPTAMQLVVYLGVLLITFLWMRLTGSRTVVVHAAQGR